MSDPVRYTSKAATAGKKCCKMIMRTFDTYLCEKPAKVVEDGKPYCGVHDPEKNRKRDAAWAAKWAQQKKAWADRDAQRAEELRRLSRYDEAIGLLRKWVDESMDWPHDKTTAFLAEEPKP